MTFGQPNLTEILEGQIFLGNLSAALSFEQRKKSGITHIVSVCPQYPSTGPNHLAIAIDDTEYENILIHLPGACQFIQDALNGGGKVLVHCVMGISRSTTVVAAYLMKTRQMNGSAAIHFIKQRRRQVHPNYGFIKQLETFAECQYDASPGNAVYKEWKRQQEQKVTKSLLYTSPFRRRKPPQPPATPPAVVTPPAPAPGRPPTPSPIRVTRRQNVVSTSASSISRSTKHKDLGGEKFKLGQYGDAEAAYTSAIACLPDSHLLLVPLYNNRALSRLKTGEHRGAVEDATKVTVIIGLRYHPAREAKVESEQEGASVDLGDGLVKALKRRAEAWEGREKWEEAGKDWEALAALEWAKPGVRGDAVRGAGRCRRMVQAASNNGGEVSASQPPARVKPPPSKPAPSRRPRPGVMTPPSQALENLRTASYAAEAEDQQRHDLTDGVDAKLCAWKGGKEANFCALLGSLDTVLWPELGLQKVGMADLVSPSQVRIRYTKTIAKLHPDKINASNTTVEQRMIANDVFSALNEAWNAFKQ